MSGVLDVVRLQRDIVHEQRLQHFAEDQERGAGNAAAAAEVCFVCVCVCVCVCLGGGGVDKAGWACRAKEGGVGCCVRRAGCWAVAAGYRS